MYISGRFKLIRKHDCDFWNLSYYRLAENKWFSYFKYSLIHRAKEKNKKKRFLFSPRKPLVFAQLSNVGKKSKGFLNPFLNLIDQKLLKLGTFRRLVRFKRKISQRPLYRNRMQRNFSYFRFFLKRSLRYVSYLYKRAYYKRDAISQDLLLGIKTRFRLYKPHQPKYLIEKKQFFQRLFLFYNNFDKVKLHRFGKLARKGQAGGINFFFSLLESRLDSIILRFNLCSKFILRSLILSNKILVNNKPISYFNFIVPKYSFVEFVHKFKDIVYYNLKKRIAQKRFYVQPPIYFEINYRTLVILIVPKLLDPLFVSFPFFESNSKIISGLHTVLWGF